MNFNKIAKEILVNVGNVENIKEVNHMEKEDVNKGDKILIFKQNLSIL